MTADCTTPMASTSEASLIEEHRGKQALRIQQRIPTRSKTPLAAAVAVPPRQHESNNCHEDLSDEEDKVVRPFDPPGVLQKRKSGTATATETASPKVSQSGAPYVDDVQLLTHSFLFDHPSLGNSCIIPATEALPIEESVLILSNTPQPENGDTNDGSGNRRRPAFVTVTIIKPRADSTLGLRLATDGGSGSVYIAGFAPQHPDPPKDDELPHLLAMSPLGEGDVFLSVNSTNCAGLDHRQVLQLIRSSPGGCPLTISVENISGDAALVETMVEKATPDTRVGLAFRQTFVEGGFVQVASVRDLFRNSFVQKGDRVVAVNGQRPTTVAVAFERIREAPRFVSVTVESRTGVVAPARAGVVEEEDENNKSSAVETECVCSIM